MIGGRRQCPAAWRQAPEGCGIRDSLGRSMRTVSSSGRSRPLLAWNQVATCLLEAMRTWPSLTGKASQRALVRRSSKAIRSWMGKRALAHSERGLE